MNDEHIIRHENDKTAVLQSALERMKIGVIGTPDKEQHTFLITKTDGSQRMFRANYVEFNVANKSAEFFKTTGHIKGTIFKNIENIEELELC